MSPGGDPERDDSGLPPVDIEIPDDARDLDRDLQAYRREQRAQRRTARRSRWHRSLIRDGIVLPLLACCLILALITGTLLTVFTATSEQGLTGTPGSGTNSALVPGGPGIGQAYPHIVGVAGLLPRASIAADGRGPIRLDGLTRTMLVLVPPGCNCSSTLTWLADVARTADAAAYLVYNQQTSAEVHRLHRQLDYGSQAVLMPARDTADVLTGPDRFPAGILPSQLTAILISPARTVHYATSLIPGDNMAGLLQAMTY